MLFLSFSQLIDIMDAQIAQVASSLISFLYLTFSSRENCVIFNEFISAIVTSKCYIIFLCNLSAYLSLCFSFSLSLCLSVTLSLSVYIVYVVYFLFVCLLFCFFIRMYVYVCAIICLFNICLIKNTST